MVRKRKEKVEIQRLLLGIIGTAGIISVALLAPNAFQIFKTFKKISRRTSSPRYLSETVQKLKRKRWIYWERTEQGTFIRLTKKGRLELMKYERKEKTLERKKWDGKWRLVIFDVKEYKRGTRDKIREYIRAFGLVRLQDSVWVYPYPCEEIISLLKAECHMGKEVLSVIAEKMENDAWLRKKFQLAH